MALNPISPQTIVPLFQTLDAFPFRLASRSLEGQCNALGDWLYERGPFYQFTAEKIGLLKPALQIGIGLQELRAYIERREAALGPLLPEGTTPGAPPKTWADLQDDADRLITQWTRTTHRTDAFVARVELLRRDLERAHDAKLPDKGDARQRAKDGLAYVMGLGEGIVQAYARIDPHEGLADVSHNVSAELSAIEFSHPEQPDETPGLMDNLQIYVAAHHLKISYLSPRLISDDARAKWLAILHVSNIRILTTGAMLWGASQVHPK